MSAPLSIGQQPDSATDKKRMQGEFLASAWNNVSASAFLLLMELANVEALIVGIKTGEGTTLDVDVSQRKLHSLGRALGIALRACGDIDQVTFKRLQHAVMDGMADMRSMDDAKAGPYLEVLHAVAGNRFKEFVAYQVERAEAEAPQIVLPDQKLAVQL